MKSLHINKKAGAKEGTILFLHGAASSSRVFDEALSSEKLPYSMISFDLPGHGQSYRSDNEGDYSIESYKNAILEVAEGIGDVLLVGNSIGGHLALEVAGEISDLKGLVIFGAPPVKSPINITEAFLPNPALQYYFTEEVAEKDLNMALNEAVQNKSVIPVLREDFQNCDPKIRGVLGKEIAGGTAFSDEAGIFRELEVPRYIIQGRQDPTVNLEYIENLCNESGGTAEIFLIENCGHYASLEHPDIFIEKLGDIALQTLP